MLLKQEIINFLTFPHFFFTFTPKLFHFRLWPATFDYDLIKLWDDEEFTTLRYFAWFIGRGFRVIYLMMRLSPTLD